MSHAKQTVTKAASGDTPSHDDVFTILSNERRRHTVRAMQELSMPIELGDLAEHVAAWELEKDVAAITSTERRRVYTSLQQTHLDKLEEAEIIECDRKTIKPTERLEDLEFYLEVVPEDEIPWAQYYLGLAGIGSIAVFGAFFNIYPVPDLSIAALLLLAFAVSAAAHICQTNRHTSKLTESMTGGRDE